MEEIHVLVDGLHLWGKRSSLLEGPERAKVSTVAEAVLKVDLDLLVSTDFGKTAAAKDYLLLDSDPASPAEGRTVLIRCERISAVWQVD